jgi:hypothetical protein
MISANSTQSSSIELAFSTNLGSPVVMLVGGTGLLLALAAVAGFAAFTVLSIDPLFGSRLTTP